LRIASESIVSKTQIKILHVTERFLGETEGWVYPQVKGDGMWESAVASLYRANEEVFPVAEVYAFSQTFPSITRNRMARSFLYRYPSPAIFWFQRVLRKKEFDIMHCHFGDFSFHALPLKATLKIPMVTMFYGYDATMLPFSNPVWRKRYQKLFSAGDIFLAEGSNMLRILVQLGCPEEKVRIYHLGIPVEQIQYNERHFHHGDTLNMLFVGAFRQKKGIPYAVEAFALAKKEYPHMRLTIVGDALSSTSIEEKNRILEYVKRYEVSDSVTFLGMQSSERLNEEYYNHHLFLSPSIVADNGDKEGGSPVTITEASATGMPIISTYHCDIPEVVKNGETGLLAEEKDTNRLSENILFFVRNEGAINRFGSSARQHIETEYSLTVQLKRLMSIYEELLIRAT
jgi:colanic acid/amylovoran biosynthesis glycosyltransferase